MKKAHPAFAHPLWSCHRKFANHFAGGRARLMPAGARSARTPCSSSRPGSHTVGRSGSRPGRFTGWNDGRHRAEGLRHPRDVHAAGPGSATRSTGSNASTTSPRTSPDAERHEHAHRRECPGDARPRPPRDEWLGRSRGARAHAPRRTSDRRLPGRPRGDRAPRRRRARHRHWKRRPRRCGGSSRCPARVCRRSQRHRRGCRARVRRQRGV